MNTDVVAVSLFTHRLAAICEEMGAVLRHSAVSPNIRDREDYSCALFDRSGALVSQAAHIPVHLGSMAFAMREVTGRFHWQEGDVVVFNDPRLGGTHLPDITVVMPVFIQGELAGFSAARAHHADIGGRSPGSMGLETRLEDEGLVIAPCYWFKAGQEQGALMDAFRQRVRSVDERLADLAAQRAACAIGARRLAGFAPQWLATMFHALMQVSSRYGQQCIAAIPDGIYRFEDVLEDDGCGSGTLVIRVCVTIDGERAHVDFTGSAAQTAGPVNCPLAVTAASVFYVFRCLMPAHVPQTAAIFEPITLTAVAGSLVNAGEGAAVAAGNVETSQRIVDVMLGALAQALPERIPAAAQGTMNNVIFGSAEWVYYETLAGGMGAHAAGAGVSAVQCHMTNTKNSSVEVLEMHYPLRVRTYGVRRGSGGEGMYRGGDGLVREWEVLQECHLSLLSERRQTAPFGLAGGEDGSSGRNMLYHHGAWRSLPAKCTQTLVSGDVLRVETPGGGGYGSRLKNRQQKDI
ncbi:hydantoinase B/oxoprolinase family protein [Mariprofundus erugo]|uniref:Hydantoinase B/oxoprolinase family protein n=1 Tax=Mariprofundus erugo TaxID=2528639 RepID=A0A5R9GPS7_9PROT|nr:hydantoinase B/oxoprolinase family protein [Mariprofundus erugo]TLS67970.1 hydantoinase B/oxoprolinase family protein [Mariprofundus erugo]